MAEEGLSPQMTPPIKIDEDHISFRRNSTGKQVSSNSGEKAIPRYLRASTGSCHDFCKYGHKSAFEENARRPIPRRVVAKPNDSQISVATVASLGRKKSFSTVLKVKSSPNAPNMTRSLDRLSFVDSDVRGEGKKTTLVKLKADASLNTLKQRVSAVSTEKLDVSLKKERNSSVTRSSPVKPKSVTSKLLSSPESSGVLNGNGSTKTGKRTVTSKAALAKVTPILSGVASLNKKSKSFRKVVSPHRNSANDVREAEMAQPLNYEAKEKTLYVIKTDTEDDTLDIDQIESCAQKVEYVVKMENGDGALELDHGEHCAQEVEYMGKIKIENNNTLESDQNETSDALAELLPHSLSLSDHPSSPSSLPNKEEEEEEDDQEELEYSVSESEDDTYSQNSTAESLENSEMLDTNNKMHKGSGMVHAEDEDEKAWKMKFRRGTVMEIQPEDNAPRRLRFRRGRMLDNQDAGADVRKRRFKRREEVVDEFTENGAEKVVLKHQDVQGKKDAQGLFNNVIEETASKLVESRKSKVKALVGAFETVISLQDGKPSSNTTAS